MREEDPSLMLRPLDYIYYNRGNVHSESQIINFSFVVVQHNIRCEHEEFDSKMSLIF